MSRYFASAGVRQKQSASENWDKYPFIVIIGPSGQFGQIIAPSGGGTGKVPVVTQNLVAFNNTVSHVPLAFYKNEILYSLHHYNTGISTDQINYAWMPYGQPSTTPKINPAAANCYNEDANVRQAGYVMIDGYEHKVAVNKIYDLYSANLSFLKIPGGSCFWAGPVAQTNARSYQYGFYKGDDPVYKVSGSTSGWMNKSYEFGDSTYNVAFKPCINSYWYGGVEYRETNWPTDCAFNICDMVYHKGTIYIASEISVAAIVPGTKGNYIFYDYAMDDNANDIAQTSTYTPRATQGIYGPNSKSFAIHRGSLYMLQGDGKVFSVSPGGIKQISNLAALGTSWSSGIFGGVITQEDGGTYAGNSNYRCYIASFNNQLHAFLNYSSTYKVAKGTDGSTTTGRGIFWATSHDGHTWSDRTAQLPSSGILPSSGSLGVWLSDISPYKISGFCGYNRSTYNVWQAIASGSSLGFSKCQPSGLQQATKIPWITSSGILVDDEGTTWNNLQLPLTKGVVKAFLSPTWIQKPGLYQTVSGSFVPKTPGASGYDYTGCHNYHVAGYSDEDKEVLHLLFSQDFHGPNANDTGKVLYYQLSKASGWDRKNYLPLCNQLNGLMPIDLYDPEIIVPSGDLYNPNPRVDEVNKKVTCAFSVYDWPFWSSVNIRMEYTTDGYTWHTACGLRGVSTGTKASDPSGVKGVQHTIVWNYDNDLSPNYDYPYLQVRLRAVEV